MGGFDPVAHHTIATLQDCDVWPNRGRKREQYLLQSVDSLLYTAYIFFIQALQFLVGLRAFQEALTGLERANLLATISSTNWLLKATTLWFSCGSQVDLHSGKRISRSEFLPPSLANQPLCVWYYIISPITRIISLLTRLTEKGSGCNNVRYGAIRYCGRGNETLVSHLLDLLIDWENATVCEKQWNLSNLSLLF